MAGPTHAGQPATLRWVGPVARPAPITAALLVGGRSRRAASCRLRGLAAGSLPPVAISSPTSSLFAVRPSRIGHDLASIHDGDPVGQLQDLVELGRDEQDGGAGVALGDRLAVDELDAADVQAARRLIEDEQLQVAAELARHDDLLLVAARQRARRDVADGVRMSNRSMRSPAPRSDGGVVAQDPARERRAVVARQDQVVREREATAPGRTDAGRPARTPTPVLVQRARARAGDVSCRQGDVAARSACAGP